jgi:hypothetical protein
MTKRFAAASLWFCAGWVTGAVLAFALDMTPMLAPIVSVLAAFLVGVDPLHAIWDRRTDVAPASKLLRALGSVQAP